MDGRLRTAVETRPFVKRHRGEGVLGHVGVPGTVWHRNALGMEVEGEAREGGAGTPTQERDSRRGSRAREIGRLDAQKTTQAAQEGSGVIGLLVLLNLLQIVLELHVLFGNAERQRDNCELVDVFLPHN